MHIVGIAYDSETNSLATSYFSIIFSMQAINSRSWKAEKGKCLTCLMLLIPSEKYFHLSILLVWAKNNLSPICWQGKVLCPEKELCQSLYSFWRLTWTSQYNVNQFFLCSFQSGDLILLVFDERYENYLVLSTGQTLFFLHPESMSGLDIATSECSKYSLLATK